MSSGNKEDVFQVQNPIGKDLLIIVYGDYGVGKSTFNFKFVQGIYVEEYDPTIEDLYQKQYQVDNQLYNLEIFDTVGCDSSDNFGMKYYHKAGVFMLLFDVNRLQSLSYVEKMIKKILHDRNVGKFPMILVGTKCDLIEDKDIDYDKINKLIEKYNIPFIKTSAKKSLNVDNAFKLAIQEESKSMDKNKSECEIM